MTALTPDDLRRALPDMGSPVTLPGLEGPGTIHRDRYGIPHVRAGSEHDAFLAQGFAHAQDRLWQMVYDRARAHGRWSELAGAEGLPVDRLMRRFQIWRTVRQDYDVLAPETRAMLDAYAAGVNGFLALGGPLPVEFGLVGAAPQPWTALDCLSVFKVRHIMMGTWEGKVWQARMAQRLGAERTAALLPGYPKGHPVLVPPGGRYGGGPLNGVAELTEGLRNLGPLREALEAGSNNWAAGGARTASGLPLMAGDPHRALDVPNVYYQNHVACPSFDVVGFSFPGVPGFPHFAHNARVAWCITHGHGDYQDLFIEQFDPARPGHYLVGEEWREAECSRETITVRGGPDEAIEVWRTRHGPVIAGDPREGWALAFCYSAMAAPNRTLDAVRAMLLARDADELEASQRDWVDPVNNLLYCDVDGAFGYRTRGQLPIRSAANGWLPVPGWTGEHDWRGHVPFEEMPAVRDPAGGYAYSANNRITDESYPHYIALNFTPGFRAERINTLLSEGRGLDAAAMRAIHGDTLSVPAVAFRDLYERITPADQTGRSALAMLREWDGRMAGDSAAATLFSTFRHKLLRSVLRPLLGELAEEALLDAGRGGAAFASRVRAALHDAIRVDDATLLPSGADWPGLMTQALAEAVAELTARHGPLPDGWRWDALHGTGARHTLSGAFPEAAPLLDPPPIPMAGDGDTVQAAGFHGERGFQVELMSVARYLFDPSDWSKSAWVIPGGASGHPGSPHYADQIGLYRQVALHPMLYDWDAIAADAESTQALSPAEQK